jgi:hypothetical protein
MLQEPSVETTLIRYLSRNLRYPEKARANKLEDVVYFSVDVEERTRGDLYQLFAEKFQLYDQAPSNARINYLQLAGYAAKTEQPAPVTESEKQNLLKQEVKQILERKIVITGSNRIIPGRYYFGVRFAMQKEG